MKAVAAGDLAPTPLGDLHLDHCLACRRCEGACPAGVEYGRLLVAGRARQFERQPPAPGLRWRLRLLARPRLLSRLLGGYRLLHPLLPRRWRPLPRPPGAPAGTSSAGGPDARVFVGCIARRYEAPARAALGRLAAAAGQRVGEPERQGCCGAAAAHAGDIVAAAALAEANRAAFSGADGPVLCLASGCQSTLAGTLADGAPVRDALAWLAEHGDGLRFRSAHGRRVGLHRPCSAFAAPGSLAGLRALLARVPDLEVLELPDTGCCGAAGLHMVAFPQRAARLAEGLHGAIAQARVEEVLSANQGCRMHLADGNVPVRHPLELLAEFLA
jgi:glycolate oxidase iron-sulfur subunit